MDKVPLSKALTKKQFHAVLLHWLSSSTDPVLAPEMLGPTAWLHVATEGGRFRLHADTKRESVTAYLDMVLAEGPDIEWVIVVNSRGNENAVAFGSDRDRIPGFYLYLVS